MDEGKIGHHHTKCLGPIDSAENLSANSFQFIGDLVGQWEHECGVDTLKWNVQPLVVVERKKLRLRGLAQKNMMTCSARAFLFRILSTAKS